MSQVKRVEIRVELPEPLFKSLEKIAYIKGTSVELVALEAIRSYIGIAADIDDHYRFKYERVVEETRRLIEAAINKGLVKREVKAENIAASLGKLVTLLRDAYGDIPRELSLDNVKSEELERLSSTLGRITGAGGRGVNPITYILNRVREVKSVSKVFGIDIVEEGGSVKAIRFNNVNLVSMYYGYGTRFLRRKIRR